MKPITARQVGAVIFAGIVFALLLERGGLK
jgi:hypothetical protein